MKRFLKPFCYILAFIFFIGIIWGYIKLEIYLFQESSPIMKKEAKMLEDQMEVYKQKVKEKFDF